MDGNTIIGGPSSEHQNPQSAAVTVHVGATTLQTVHRAGSDVVRLLWRDGETEFGEVRRGTDGEWATAVLYKPWRTAVTLRQIAEAVIDAHQLDGQVAS